jgi:hypothetical protein
MNKNFKDFIVNETTYQDIDNAQILLQDAKRIIKENYNSRILMDFIEAIRNVFNIRSIQRPNNINELLGNLQTIIRYTDGGDIDFKKIEKLGGKLTSLIKKSGFDPAKDY